MDGKHDVNPAAQTDDEDDVEGHAFKWQVVTDPKDGGKKLRAGWTPDEQPQRSPSSPPARDKNER
jgi:hypothetical protein